MPQINGNPKIQNPHNFSGRVPVHKTENFSLINLLLRCGSDKT